MIKWQPTNDPDLWVAVVAGFIVERERKNDRYLFSIGSMRKAVIKFSSEYGLIRFLTI